MQHRRLCGDSSAAGGAGGAGGATIAMVACDDYPLLQLGRIEIADVTWRARAHGQVEHLVEIAVVQRAVPANR